MGLFDFLGGITIGDIIQTVIGLVAAPARTFVHSDGTAFSEPIVSGGVTFFSQTDDTGTTIFCANPDHGNPSQPAVVMAVVPNDPLADTGGTTYLLQLDGPALEFTDAVSNSTQITVTTGPVSVEADAAAGAGSLFKLSFRGLKANGVPITIGSFQISCTTTQLTILTGGITVNAISYLYFQSNRGTIFNSASTNIQPAANTTSADDQITFDIDFASMGFNMDIDVLEGVLTLNSPDDAIDVAKHLNANAKPLSDAQKAYFKWLKKRKNKK